MYEMNSNEDLLDLTYSDEGKFVMLIIDIYMTIEILFRNIMTFENSDHPNTNIINQMSKDSRFSHRNSKKKR